MIPLAFLFTGFLAALNAALTKLAVSYIDPYAVVAGRFLFASALMLPFAVRKKHLKTISKSLIIVNLFFAANILFFALGIGKTSLIISQIFYMLSPLVVAVLGYIFLKEKLTRDKIIGLVLTIFGMTFLISNSIQDPDILTFGTPLGNLLILIAVMSWSAYIVLSKRISKDYSPLKITSFNFFVTTILSLSIILINFKAYQSFAISNSGLSTIVLLAISTVGFFFVFQCVIKHTSAFISSLILYLNPVFAYGLGAILFNERLNLEFAIGSTLVIFGIFWATSLKQARVYVKNL